MTRETKISLLVGLAFIIVIGILLSDHFHATQELPQAILTRGADIMCQATNEPGTANPPIGFVAPTESSPNSSVPTHDELTQPPSPVVPTQNYSSQNDSIQNPIIAPAPQDHGADAPSPDKNLNNLAQTHGEPLVQANIDGSSRQIDPTPPQAIEPVAAPKQYRAQEGDSVSRMASKFLGSNTRANRQAIIDANPSLQDDPDKVIVGKAYTIPTPGESKEVAQNTDNQNSTDNSNADTNSNTNTPTGEYFYTVQEGDSLWAIANDQLGDPSAVEAIKDLNQKVLKGGNHDVVVPGMKLRLPAKPVATAN